MKKPKQYLWQALGYKTAEEARQAGIDPAYETYEWLHYLAEKAEKRHIAWPWEQD